ncbi:BLOC-2 complex member HPS5 [Stigmatopora nigra]
MPRVAVVPEVHTHVLAEFDCLDPLLSTLRLDSSRLKCMSLAVSKKWLALGTSAGGLHLIQREGWKQRLILTHKEGSITQVSCCPHDEDFIAIATSQGLVVVWELQLERRGRPERVSVSWEHRGQNITALCWDTNTLKVFVGDSAGKVSFLRAVSSKMGKGSGFVMFPVQTVTTVDSKVVQLGYQDGRLLVSSLSRCYLCDTEREKFWRVGNKERDGEYGACFFRQNKGLLTGQPQLLYCARPGSRLWEASFNGEVLSTQQFKQALNCPPLPLITYRKDPHYNPGQKSPQSIAFPKLLSFGDQNLLTWTDSAIYIFTPHNGQVLLWTELKDVLDMAVYRNDLFCLHAGGRLSHLSLLSAERCVERLLRRESWTLAATVCCMFQHNISIGRARKSVPIDRLEHLRSQLSSSTHPDLIGQLDELIARLEPPDSACSSRRSSISSHESFNVLDCGIYRVISRRASQSDEETSSLINQSASEEERLKELSFAHDEDQVDHDPMSGERAEEERSEQGLQFHLPLSFRPKPPRIALQAVKDSVSSFVKKTTERINTLQMNSELWQRPDFREGSNLDMSTTFASFPDEADAEVYADLPNTESDLLELQSATEQAMSQMQDPLLLLDPDFMGGTLQIWLKTLEQVLGPAAVPSDPDRDAWEPLLHTQKPEEGPPESIPQENADNHLPSETETTVSEEAVRLVPPKALPSDLLADLTQLATFYTELSCFREPEVVQELSCTTFMRRYFFLLDQERIRRLCLLCCQKHLDVQSSFIQAMLGVTQSSKVVEVIHKGDLQKSLCYLRELQPWSPPVLLAHLHRLYAKHGEAAVQSFPAFYPTIKPADVMQMAQKSHFLAYLDNLVMSQPEEHRLPFLQSLLDPELLRQEWFELALTHDAPEQCDTLTADGQPRWNSHCFHWGYGCLLSLLTRLPADLSSKQKMAETCRNHGYWTGYLHLCCELQRRDEAFATIYHLDDISLLEEPDGVTPQNLSEWKLLLELCQEGGHLSGLNGDALSNGSTDCSKKVSTENLILRLARAVGPDRAEAFLEECGVQLSLSPHSQLVCELLKMAEKRQRAAIQSMLERCDRFLWSQHA